MYRSMVQKMACLGVKTGRGGLDLLEYQFYVVLGDFKGGLCDPFDPSSSHAWLHTGM